MSERRVDDPFARVNYRRMVAWPERIEREAPFLRESLAQAPSRRVVDLGCGTGEHAAFLAAEGYDTVGLDRSEGQIAAARDHERPAPPGPRFVRGEMEELPELVPEPFGAALSLGNVLPSLDDDELSRAMHAVRRALLEGAVLVIQILNYARIESQGLRHLPLNFRTDPEVAGEVVFLRLMTRMDERHFWFHPTSLQYEPGADPPVRVVSSREVRVRAWKRGELEELLGRAGFGAMECFGDVCGGLFDPEQSHDLVLRARAV